MLSLKTQFSRICLYMVFVVFYHANVFYLGVYFWLRSVKSNLSTAVVRVASYSSKVRTFFIEVTLKLNFIYFQCFALCLFQFFHFHCCRIYNYDPVTPLKNLKASSYGKIFISFAFYEFYQYIAEFSLVIQNFLFLGKFVAIRGTVVRVSSVKPLVTHMAFKCNTCKEIQVICYKSHNVIYFSLPLYDMQKKISKCIFIQVLRLSEGKYKIPTKV